MPETVTLEAIQAGFAEWKKKNDEAIEELKKNQQVVYATPGALEQMEAQFKKQLADVNEYAQAIEKQLKSKSLTPAEQKSFADMLGEAVEKNWSEISKFKDSNGGMKMKMQIFDTKAAGPMTIANNVLGANNFFTTVLPGIRTLPNRRVHMRDIIPLGTMSNSSVTYMREVGGEGNFAPWGVTLPATEKPVLDRDFQEVTATAEYIAGILRISRKMLDDMDSFRSYLQMRLLEMYLKAEDNQILNGNGTSPQIEGILEVAAQAIVTTGPNVERLVWAIAQVEAYEFTADGGVVHPSAYYSIALNKATGSGEYDLPGIVVVQNGQLYVAGIPIYRTTAIDSDTYVVGAWATGAQLFIREQPSVQFFEQDANNVTTNQITVRVEGRAALAIYRAEAFVQGTFDSIPVFPTFVS